MRALSYSCALNSCGCCRAPSRRSRSLWNRCNPPRSRDKVPVGTSMTKTIFFSCLVSRLLCSVFYLRRPSTFGSLEKGRVLHGVPTQEPAIFRTQKQLCRKFQQVVWSIRCTGSASSCSCLARSIFTFSKHFKNDTCSGGPS